MKKTEQFIFIDDSGDPGFKTAKGASRMFVIACIVFNNKADVEIAGTGLKTLKKQLGWKPEREFKFHRATEEQKEAFFRNIERYNFNIYATIVDKSLVAEPLKKKDDSFYQKIILETLDSIVNMKNAKVYLDGRAGKNYRKRSAAKIRQTLNKSRYRMSQLKLEDSKANNLIQLADMIAGSIRAKYDPDKFIKQDYLRFISDKVNRLHFYE